MNVKKVLYMTAVFLETAVFTGAYAIHYFTERKLGMIRYVNFKNMSWEQDYPVEILKWACAVTAAVLTVFILLVFLKKRRECTKLTAAMIVCMIVLTALYTGYTLGCSVEVMADYYFVSALLFAAATVQIVKAGLSVFLLGRRRENDREE